MSISLHQDHARRFVGHDLEPKCLQRLSADDTGRQRVLKEFYMEESAYFPDFGVKMWALWLRKFCRFNY